MAKQKKVVKQKDEVAEESKVIGGSPSNSATVCSGLFREELPVTGMTVAQIRDNYAQRFDIDPASTAVVDGVTVDSDTEIKEGQLLMFVRQAGEKG